jgi:hypothetical protein
MGHNFLVAAFCCTWGIQLSYVTWMALKWQGQQGKLRSIKSITGKNR